MTPTREQFATCILLVFIGLLFTSSISAQVDPGSIVGVWLFDEGSGSIAKDNSGNGYDADLMETPVWTQGIRGQALQFQNGSYLEIRNSAENLGFGGVAPFTIAAWVKSQGGGTVVGKYNAGIIGAHFLQIQGDGTIAFDRESPPWVLYGSKSVPNNDFGHVAATYDGTTLRLYVNGVLDIEQDWAAQSTDTETPVLIGARHEGGTPGVFFNGVIDEVAMFNVALTAEQIQTVMKGLSSSKALSPVPEDGTIDVARDTSLSWTAADTAATHTVYFGTSREDVDTASTNTPLNVLVSEGQTETSYTPESVLTLGESYYWRVDEVNSAPDYTVFKGNVWGFTVEPISFPIETITATASDTAPGMEPSKTVDGSGLNAQDQHSISSMDMWLSGIPTGPVWIQYEFDKAYKLYEIQVWNSNQLIESFIGFGTKEVAIETSTDGTSWTALGAVTQLERAPGRAGYTANTSIDMSGTVARYVRLNMVSAYGFTGQFGLSEVRFLAIPTFARNPQPASGALVDTANVPLSWRVGRDAAEHRVSLGTDATNLSLLGTVTDNRIQTGALDFATTYYWSVTEVNQAETPADHGGDVWSFTTPDHAVVDNFDGYTDDLDAGGAIFQTWADGFDDDSNGALVGHEFSPFAEQTVVRSGQSMPLSYDNTAGKSEATIPLNQDWSASGIKTLSLFFHGSTANTGQLYVKINNEKVDYRGDADDIQQVQWQPWLIDLTALGTLQNVTSLTIGVEGAGAAGLLYIDDIRLYPRPIELVIPVEPDNSALLVHYPFDEGAGTQATDASGQGNHGVVGGDPQWTAGVDGSAIAFDGRNDYVSAQKSLLSDLEQFTIACWIKADTTSADRSGLVGQNDCVEYGFASPNTLQIWTPGGGSLNYTWPYDDTDWHHIAAVGDGASLTLYLDGRSVATGGSATNNYGASDFPLNIAGDGVFDAIGNAFFGQLDEVRVYNQALSPEELASLAGHTEPLQKPF